MTQNVRLMLLLTLINFMVLMACRQAPEIRSTAKSYLYVQSAKSAALVPVDAERNLYQLMLNDVSDKTIYFSDRPVRDAGQINTPSFLSQWGEGNNSFKSNPPNAALDVQNGKGQSSIFILELQNPQWNNKNNSLKYDVEILESPVAKMDFLQNRAAHKKPEKSIDKHQGFTEAVLFIDDQILLNSCTESDVKAGINPENRAFWSQMNQCATSAMGDADKTAACLGENYPTLSGSCRQCFGKMASCVAQHCMFACMFNHQSNGCEQCAYHNCDDSSNGRGFNLSACTGLPAEKLPPAQ